MQTNEEKKRKHQYKLWFPCKPGFDFYKYTHSRQHPSFKIVEKDGRQWMIDTATREILMPSKLMREMIENEDDDNEEEHQIPFDKCDSNSWALIKHYLNHLHAYGYTISPTNTIAEWNLVEEWTNEKQLRVCIEDYKTLENVYQDHWRVDFFRRLDQVGKTIEEQAQITNGIRDLINSVDYLHIPILAFDLKLYLYYRMLCKPKAEVIRFTGIVMDKELNEKIRKENPWIFNDIFNDALELKRNQVRFRPIEQHRGDMEEEEEYHDDDSDEEE